MKGYITFADTKTNISRVVTIRGYAGEISDDMPYTEYVFDKISMKLLSKDISDIAYLPYMTALRILDQALLADKKQLHYVEMSFEYEKGSEPRIKIERVVKELFPLPHKSITYLPKAVFANVTYQLSGRKLLSNLEASLYAYHYNNIAVRDGFRSDRIFYSSCGRLLMLTDEFMSSIQGRRLIKELFDDIYPAVRSCSAAFVKTYKLIKSPVSAVSFDHEKYSNPFLQAHILVSKRLADVKTEHALCHTELVSELVQKQLEIYRYQFERDYYANLVSDISMYQYLSIDDLLRAHIDAEFRVNLNKYILDIRKIYNANKSIADFKCIMSDGRMI